MLMVSHGEEDHDRCRHNDRRSARDHRSDDGSLEQHKREGDEIGKPTTFVVEAIKHRDDRRYEAVQHEALTQCRQGTPSVGVSDNRSPNSKEGHKSQG